MERPAVVVLEHHELIRLALRLDLEVRGFTVHAAGTVHEARDLIQQHGKDLEVAVLCMSLEDRDAVGVTGVDMGMEILRQTSLAPEFLIYSALNSVDYYQRALRLGAAAYLDKSKSTSLDVVRYTRALALRRSLGLKSPALLEKVRHIAGSSLSPAQAASRFCAEVLRNELQRALRVPWVLLLTETRSGGVLYADGLRDSPVKNSEFWRDLQRLIFLTTHGEPLVLLPERLRSLGWADADGELAWLRNAAFLQLATTEEVQLSLGILQEDISENPLAEEAEKLAGILAQMLRSASLEPLFNLVGWLTASTRFAIHELVTFANGVASGLQSFETYVRLGKVHAPPEVLEIIKRMERSAAELNTLFRPFSSVTALEQRCSLARAIGAARRLRGSVLHQTGFAVHVDGEDDGGLTDVPFHILTLTLSHLITNAVDAMMASGKGSKITIVLREHGDVLECAVRDDGPGIDPSLKDVFCPGQTTKDGGHGWGLHLTRRSLLEHNARIEITYTGPEGTEITLYLPKSKQEKDDGQPSSHGT